MNSGRCCPNADCIVSVESKSRCAAMQNGAFDPGSTPATPRSISPRLIAPAQRSSDHRHVALQIVVEIEAGIGRVGIQDADLDHADVSGSG